MLCTEGLLSFSCSFLLLMYPSHHEWSLVLVCLSPPRWPVWGSCPGPALRLPKALGLRVKMEACEHEVPEVAVCVILMEEVGGVQEGEETSLGWTQSPCSSDPLSSPYPGSQGRKQGLFSDALNGSWLSKVWECILATMPPPLRCLQGEEREEVERLGGVIFLC